MTPFISRIAIFPVKSLDALEVQAARVLSSGALMFDRQWALFDAQGRVVNAKRHAAIHLLRARFDPGAQTLAVKDQSGQGLPDATFALAHDRAALERWLRAYFGFEVHLRTDNTAGFPDDLHSPGPTLIGASTLDAMADWFGLGLEQMRARLRTNVEIGGTPPFWEDCLFGQAGEAIPFRLGPVTLAGINPCQRCVVPARDPLTGEVDQDFATRFSELRARTMPIWADRTRFDHFYRVAVNTRLHGSQSGHEIRVGDRLDLQDPTRAPVSSASATPADFWSGTLAIAEIRDEAPGVKTFQLRHPTGNTLPFRFLPGQFVTVTIEAGAERLRRSYTLSSSPAQTGSCEITVKRDGSASSALHNATPGATLAVAGPFGRFTFDERDATAIVLIAGGVGITPLMSKLRYLARIRWPGRIDLVYSAKRQQDLIFQAELLRLHHDLPGFRMHVTLTAPDEAWNGARGRLSETWIRSVVPDIADRQIRLCGPTGMATETRRILRQLGVQDTNIASESFGGPPEAPIIDDGILWPVTFERSGPTILTPSAHSVLTTALAAGIALDCGCLAGVCGRCKVKLLRGKVATGCEDALSAKEKEDGLILACQSRPLGPVTLDC